MPEQMVEFLATAWAEDELHRGSETRHVILGSPWYVAVARKQREAQWSSGVSRSVFAETTAAAPR